jgi:Flp pilus assembly protein TadG
MGRLVEVLRRGKRVLARFRDRESGTTAVEFALIAPFFFAIILAIFEVTIYLFAQATLQEAATSAGRLIMTGQMQNGSVTQSQFANNYVCPMVQVLFNCTTMMVNVQSYASFSASSTQSPTLTYNSNGSVSNTWNYDLGTPGQIVVLQLIYQWPIIGGPFGYVLSNLGNGTTEMVAVTAFRVEPY